MRYSSHGRFREQMRFLRCQFAQNSALPFSDILTEDLVARALTAAGVFWINRIYYYFNNLVHGKRPKRSIEGPQICTKAVQLVPRVSAGKDFVAIKQDYAYRNARAGLFPPYQVPTAK